MAADDQRWVWKPNVFLLPASRLLGWRTGFPLFPGPNGAWRALGLTSGLGLLLSGLTVRSCLRKLAPEPTASWASAFYVLAPFHLAVTLYERAAYAEFWSYVWMPLVLRGILEFRTRQRSAGWSALTGFAGLFLTQLPTTVTFTPMALFLAIGLGARTAGCTILALLAALGVTAAYWLPCLALRPVVQTQTMSLPWPNTFFFPTWHLLQPLSIPDAFNTRLFLIFLCWVAVLGCCHATYVYRRDCKPHGRTLWCWLCLGLLGTSMMLPVSFPLYQHFEPLQMIQFTWRHLTPVTLLWAGLLAPFWPSSGQPRFPQLLQALAWCFTVLCLAGITFSVTADVADHYQRGPARSKDQLRIALDAREYLPTGTSLTLARDLLGTERLRANPSSTRFHVRLWQPRNIAFAVECDESTTLWIRQLWFPGWQATLPDGTSLPVQRDERTGVLMMVVPAGTHDVRLTRPLLPAERWGIGISLCSLGSVGIVVLFLRQHKFWITPSSQHSAHLSVLA